MRLSRGSTAARRKESKGLACAPKLASGWQIGEPDMVFQMPS